MISLDPLRAKKTFIRRLNGGIVLTWHSLPEWREAKEGQYE